ncbi:short-chain dehydrogenase/reductase SDR [Methylobacterium sp. 4-46]|uniref:SDR family oxidoreductase n=1 Tax=unclassified Methylobacterium TaxID=2615210 RepID=UPI000165C78E|nr:MULTISPECIES: SDR family oxidoreductase [Methylobacterium]ACA16546.1 short-chain dehydrogenase/reductase SDR [Methylobacterium sp. 4-46]WFT82255.1 SDR family oxidoreductase [Methylobacterium nodulans]
MSPRRPSAVVTGGTAGVGRAVALAFARRGYDVAVLARGRRGIDGTLAELRRAGARALGFQADVADAGAVQRAADAVAEAWAGIDVWVNNAMVTAYAPVRRLSPDEFRQVTAVTYLGQVHGTLAALRHMAPADRGTIVCIGSALAYRSIPLQAPYCAAKAAVRGFVDSLRCEILHDGSRVRLTMVQLPAVNTPQFDWARSVLPRRLQPVPPIYQPEAIARHVVRAAEEAPRELWIGPPAWQAILGTLVAPGLLDRYLATAAYEGEMTPEPADPHRPDNLFGPVDTDPGAHGRFDGRARASVVAAAPSTLKAGLALGLGLLAGGALLAARRPRR